jgi:hypothetical protein
MTYMQGLEKREPIMCPKTHEILKIVLDFHSWRTVYGFSVE